MRCRTPPATPTQALERKINKIKASRRPQTDLIIAILWSLSYIFILLVIGSLIFAYVHRDIQWIDAWRARDWRIRRLEG